MYNPSQSPRPGSYRGDGKVDLTGPDHMLERARSRMQDHAIGGEEAARAAEASGEAARDRKEAARQAREGTGESLGDRARVWWSRHFHRS